MRRAPRFAVVVTLGLELGLLLAGRAAGQAGVLQIDEVRAALTVLRDGDAQAGDECRERLSGLGTRGIPALVAVLLEPELVADEHGSMLDRRGEEAVLASLLAQPWERVLPSIQQALAQVESFEQRRRWVDLLGRVGGTGTVELLVGLVAGMEPVARQLVTVQRELEQSLGQVLRRSPEEYPRLIELCERVEPRLQTTLALALGSAGSGRGLPVLERMMGRSPELDRAVLEAVGRLDPADPDCLRGCAPFLAWHLTSDDPAARGLAASSLAHHGGTAQLGGLIELLEDPDPRARRSGHFALRAVAGLDLGLAGEPWRTWLQREFDWYRLSAPELVRTALYGELAPAHRALRELAEHPLFRRELAAELAPALERPEEPLAVAACQALGRLGGPIALAPLRDALADERVAVAAAAASALRALEPG